MGPRGAGRRHGVAITGLNGAFMCFPVEQANFPVQWHGVVLAPVICQNERVLRVSMI
jgi:hypothetical protein